MSIALGQQQRHETGVDLDRAHAARRLWPLYPQTVPARVFDAALDAQRPRDRVEVFPPQRQDLGAARAGERPSFAIACSG